MEKLRNTIKKWTGALIIIGALASCNPVTETAKNEIKGIILPHHLIVEQYIDELYKLTAEKDLGIDRIIIFSPNHFNYGFNYIQTTDQDYPSPSPELDKDFIDNLSKSTPIQIEPKDFPREHGITVELPFITKYFPHARVVPIILKNGTPENRINMLTDAILKSDLSKTLIISSIDFTHYESESIAKANDERTANYLANLKTKPNLKDLVELSKSPSEKENGAIAIDSPESLYAILRIMESQNHKDISIWKRTSSASLTGIADPMQNTSHLFVIIK